jgi:hypothetical protein
MAASITLIAHCPSFLQVDEVNHRVQEVDYKPLVQKVASAKAEDPTTEYEKRQALAPSQSLKAHEAAWQQEEAAWQQERTAWEQERTAWEQERMRLIQQAASRWACHMSRCS